MDGDRKVEAEFTIDRGAEKDRDASTSSPRGASKAPPRERAEQAEFDLGAKGQREADGGMPERVRRKYYVAEADVGAEAKVYADPKGEYLAFKVSAERMATRLEDAGVIRDMVSIAQHRNWKEVEIRGSEEFRRTAWLEASARGISVRGYEPDPVDRAALAFRAKPKADWTQTVRKPRTNEAGASETVTIDGVATRRPIDVTVMPPESRTAKLPPRSRANETAPVGTNAVAQEPSASLAGRPREDYLERSIIAIEHAASETGTSRLRRDKWRVRADQFRTADPRNILGDGVAKAARSQLLAIQRALTKAVRNPGLRQSILSFAKERIAQELEKGREFVHIQVGEIQSVRSEDKQSRTMQAHKDRSNQPRSGHDR